MAATEDLVARILRNDRRAVESAKETILEVIGRPLDDQLKLEALLGYAICGQSPAIVGRSAAFFDKTDWLCTLVHHRPKTQPTPIGERTPSKQPPIESKPAHVRARSEDQIHAARDNRQQRSDRGFTRVGSMGESQGGNAAILLDKQGIMAIVKRSAERIYGHPYELRPLDAIVSLYGSCGVRRDQDVFQKTPFLFLTGEDDDEAPSRLCEQYVPWTSERGAAASIVVLPGVGHSFDAPYQRIRSFSEQFADCDLIVDAAVVKNVKTGASKSSGEANVQAMMNGCRGKGFHTGYTGDRFVGVPHWIGFLKKNL